MKLLLMPGMDGTGDLFREFLTELSPEWTPQVVSYPNDRALSYDELLPCIAIPDEPFAIVAESFSGPLAIQLAALHKSHVRALVLVASFARAPTLARYFGWAAFASLFAAPPPKLAIRSVMLGFDGSAIAVDQVKRAVASVHGEVLAARVRSISSVDVRAAFTAADVPVLYVAGSRDRLLGLSAMRELSALRVDMESVVLDAPHLVLQAQPKETGRHIEEFLSRVAHCVRTVGV